MASLDVSILRSNLQYCCDDLTNLVTSDLDECKWPIKRRIYMSLLKRAPSLSVFFDEIFELEENRANQRKSNKSNSLSSESLMEQEKKYRTRFIQIIANALTQLRWPPALEPFCDILGSLFDDKFSVHDSFDYIMKIGLNVMQERERMVDLQRFKENSSPREHLEMGLKTSRMPIENSSFPYSNSNSNNNDNLNFINDKKSENRNIEKKLRPNSSNTSLNSSPRSTFSASHQSDIKHARSEAKSEIFHDLATLTRAFHILQHHNEELLKRLKAMQEIINNREAVEVKLDHILDDLSKVIEEVVGISSYSTLTGSDSGSGSGATQSHIILNTESDPVGGREVAGGRSETLLRQEKVTAATSKYSTSDPTPTVPLPRRGRNSTPTTTTTTSTTPSTTLSGNQRFRSTSQGPSRTSNVKTVSGIGTEKDKEKVMSVDEDTTSSTFSRMSLSPRGLPSDSSSEMLQSASLSIKSNDVNINNNSNSNSKGTSQFKSQLTTSSKGIWSKLRSQILSLKEMWLGARRELGRLSFATVSLYPPEQSNIESFLHTNSTKIKTGKELNSSSVTTKVTSGELLLRQLLAVRPQLSKKYQSDSSCNTSFMSENNSIDYGLALDTVRIHQLQRSLIDFVESVSNLLCHSTALNTTDDAESDLVGASAIVWPLTTPWCTVLHALQSLKDRASDLVLQTSLLAPVSAMSLKNPILSSHCTGLEALIAEIANVINVIRNKKSISNITLLLPKLEQALDRNRKEQISIAIEYRKAQRIINGWNLAASVVTKQLEGFCASAGKELQGATDSLSELTHSVSVVMEAYHGAENSRLSTTSSSTSNSDIAGIGLGSGKPLDALARGCLGVEVANLINALRLHNEDLKELPVRMTDIRKKFTCDVTLLLNKLSGYGLEIENLSKRQQQSRKGAIATTDDEKSGFDRTPTSGSSSSSSSSSKSKKRQSSQKKS